MELFLPLTRFGRAIDDAPFLASFLAKALAYCGVIVCIVGGRLGMHAVARIFDSALVNQVQLLVEAKVPVSVLIPVALLVTPFGSEQGICAATGR